MFENNSVLQTPHVTVTVPPGQWLYNIYLTTPLAYQPTTHEEDKKQQESEAETKRNDDVRAEIVKDLTRQTQFIIDGRRRSFVKHTCQQFLQSLQNDRSEICRDKLIVALNEQWPKDVFHYEKSADEQRLQKIDDIVERIFGEAQTRSAEPALTADDFPELVFFDELEHAFGSRLGLFPQGGLTDIATYQLNIFLRLFNLCIVNEEICFIYQSKNPYQLTVTTHASVFIVQDNTAYKHPLLLSTDYALQSSVQNTEITASTVSLPNTTLTAIQTTLEAPELNANNLQIMMQMSALAEALHVALTQQLPSHPFNTLLHNARTKNTKEKFKIDLSTATTTRQFILLRQLLRNALTTEQLVTILNGDWPKQLLQQILNREDLTINEKSCEEIRAQLCAHLDTIIAVSLRAFAQYSLELPQATWQNKEATLQQLLLLSQLTLLIRDLALEHFPDDLAGFGRDHNSGIVANNNFILTGNPQVRVEFTRLRFLQRVLFLYQTQPDKLALLRANPGVNTLISTLCESTDWTIENLLSRIVPSQTLLQQDYQRSNADMLAKLAIKLREAAVTTFPYINLLIGTNSHLHLFHPHSCGLEHDDKDNQPAFMLVEIQRLCFVKYVLSLVEQNPETLPTLKTDGTVNSVLCMVLGKPDWDMADIKGVISTISSIIATKQQNLPDNIYPAATKTINRTNRLLASPSELSRLTAEYSARCRSWCGFFTKSTTKAKHRATEELSKLSLFQPNGDQQSVTLSAAAYRAAFKDTCWSFWSLLFFCCRSPQYSRLSSLMRLLQKHKLIEVTADSQSKSTSYTVRIKQQDDAASRSSSPASAASADLALRAAEDSTKSNSSSSLSSGDDSRTPSPSNNS